MTRVDASHARCWVLTFKEGLLSSVAHDLKLRVSRFELTVDMDGGETRIAGWFDSGSLQVVCAMRGDEEDRRALSPGDLQDIEARIVKEVLDAQRHPRIRFVSTSVVREAERWRIRGELSVNGRSRTVTAQTQNRSDQVVTEVRIHQPDFGIRPYSAMLGTLRVKPDVVVRLEMPSALVGGPGGTTGA